MAVDGDDEQLLRVVFLECERGHFIQHGIIAEQVAHICRIRANKRTRGGQGDEPVTTS